MVALLGLPAGLMLLPSLAGAVTETPASVTSPTSAIAQPANLYASGSGSGATSISCTGPGACQVVGFYSGPGTEQISTLQSTSNAGTFAGAQQWQILLSNSLTSDPFAVLGSISCFSPGACVAAGTYEDADGNLQPLFASSSNGVWTYQEIPAPSSPTGTQQIAALEDVSCTSPTSCVAVGEYQNSSNVQQPLAVGLSASGATWTASVSSPTLPANAYQVYGTEAALFSVSCLSAASCVAVGTYSVSSTSTEPLIATGSAAGWTTAEMLPPTSPPSSDAQEAALNSVSCVPGSSCFAVGSYLDSGNLQQAMLTEDLSTALTSWLPVVAQLPSGALANPSAELNSISCWGVGLCEAVGDFASQSGQVGLIVSSPDGGWLPGTAVSAPITTGSSELQSVSCVSTGECTAVGDFQVNTPNQQLMTLSIAQPLVLSTSRARSATVHHSYRLALAATGGSGTYTWRVSAGKLPPGLRLNAVTGVISGSPKKAATFRFTVQATDAGPPTQNASERFSLVVKAPPHR